MATATWDSSTFNSPLFDGEVQPSTSAVGGAGSAAGSSTASGAGSALVPSSGSASGGATASGAGASAGAVWWQSLRGLGGGFVEFSGGFRG